MAPRLELFPFHYRDPRTGKWVRARYVAELHEVAARFAELELIGEPEVRDVDPNARYFNPQTGAGPGHRTVKDPPPSGPNYPLGQKIHDSNRSAAYVNSSKTGLDRDAIEHPSGMGFESLRLGDEPLLLRERAAEDIWDGRR
jgi:hypothetical protein